MVRALALGKASARTFFSAFFHEWSNDDRHGTFGTRWRWLLWSGFWRGLRRWRCHFWRGLWLGRWSRSRSHLRRGLGDGFCRGLQERFSGRCLRNRLGRFGLRGRPGNGSGDWFGLGRRDRCQAPRYDESWFGGQDVNRLNRHDLDDRGGRRNRHRKMHMDDKQQKQDMKKQGYRERNPFHRLWPISRFISACRRRRTALKLIGCTWG